MIVMFVNILGLCKLILILFCVDFSIVLCVILEFELVVVGIVINGSGLVLSGILCLIILI